MAISLKNMRGCASPASTAIYNGTPRLIQRRRYSNSPSPFSIKKHFRRKSSAVACGYRRLMSPTNTTSFREELPLQPIPVYRRDLDTSVALAKSRSTDERVISNSSPLPTPCSHQIVVLRVSLHCRGCEGKLRKHLSKMQGVTSFSIDLEAKKVTVIGEITPVDVLTSISKVKNAQFWPVPFPST